MAFQQKNNSGSLFKNDKKQTDKHPDYKGTAIVDGVNKNLAAWIRTSQTGKKYMSITIQDPEPKTGFDTIKDDQSGEDIPF